MSSPPAKRKRTEDSQITRSESIWIPDGNVILQAGNMQFRVHFGVLARHSAVFRDMQGLPQPPDEPRIEGCPVLELSDNPEDVEYVLKALYDPTFHSQETLPLPVVRALVRLGRKYEFKALLNSAVARLTTECPRSLDKCDNLITTGKWRTIEGYGGIYFDIPTLASENNILTALPFAYYMLVVMNCPGELFDGIVNSDGTRSSLPQVDLRRCAVGQQRLHLKQLAAGYTFGWARSKESTGCMSLALCQKLREGFIRAFTEGSPNICALIPHDTEGLNRYEFCASCALHMRESVAAGRKRIWEELPEIFDLPPWNELENDL
ncbi:BTB domain-containing protein [Mycena sanguinolenta]|uniref:BTB domain-containing protein n=1 Tax=Mycena sanguinolenta TaxID=230812 RepID=A0A8H7DEU0_9AGAR|nr:BTB domain-containing protein [Mycena sanguinolenta]